MKTALAVAGALFLGLAGGHWLASAGQTDQPAANQPGGAGAEQAPRLSADEVMAELEDSFEAELLDRQWGKPTQEALLAAFGGNASAMRPNTVECRSESCRLEFDAAAERSRTDIALAMSAADLGEWVVDSRDPTTLVVYAARMGSKLAAPL